MIHKIHQGADLPSVQAGTPYQIVGFGGSVHDYSDVVFPADTRRCTTCHAADAGAEQHDAWYTNPTRVACGSCHDDVNFATGENHAGLPQPSDNQCKNCHIPEGELEFDISIMGAHTIPEQSKELPGTVVQLTQVFDHSQGQHPRVAFKLTDKEGNPLVASEIDRMRLTLDGPTTDYPMEPIVEDAKSADGGANGEYMYTFEAAIPMDATGSWAVSAESRQAVTLLPGTVKEMVVEDTAANPVLAFAVDGSEAMPRREIVNVDNCNVCHGELALHGGNRKSIQYCVMCHNPNADDAVVRPEDQLPAEAIDFRTMIHRIHTGKELARVQDGGQYLIYGFRSSLHDYSTVGYPGFRNNCEGCHVGNSQQVPLPKTNMEVHDPRGWINPVGPTAAACLSCHDNIYAASHALANTSSLGESCAVCHGDGKPSSVDRVHAR
jgi:OmcA/MtrC family decaheme c-type cytochrome